jgi:FAD/FMN-containing dehydrogenase
MKGSFFAPLSLFILFSYAHCQPLASNERCRITPGAAHEFCGLPTGKLLIFRVTPRQLAHGPPTLLLLLVKSLDPLTHTLSSNTALANFQGNFQCQDGVKIGRPTSIEQAQQMINLFSKVKASGVGHSWGKELFCAGSDEDSLNIILTELPSVLGFIKNPVKPSQWLTDAEEASLLGAGATTNTTTSASASAPLIIPVDFPIKVDEDAATVTVEAGIPQRMLLDYLAEYTHWKEPAGWTLPAFSWFLDQSIGGAVATGTHGSSLTWGSLSSQLRALKFIAANGTLVELTPDSNPHLWKAMGVSVGRLGIITELTLRIVPQSAIQRSLADISFNEWTDQVLAVQQNYTAAKADGDVEGMAAALKPLDDTQSFWIVPTAQMWRTDFEKIDGEGLEEPVMLNIDTTDPLVQAMNGPNLPLEVYDQEANFTVVPPVPEMGDMNATAYWTQFFWTSARGYVRPGVYPRRRAFLSMTEAGSLLTGSSYPYDQYEVSIPIEIAGTCLKEVGAEIYGPQELWRGFRTQCLTRFISGEEFYISNTNGGPRMYINMEDYISRSNGNIVNTQFQKVIALFREKCGARLHWGKAGFPRHAPCFDGAVEYGESWCNFGCAVNELDPDSKFQSEWNGWRFKATRGEGEEVQFSSCCTAEGFNSDLCQCVSDTSCLVTVSEASED